MESKETLEKKLEQGRSEIGILSEREASYIEGLIFSLEKKIIPYYKESLKVLDAMEEIGAKGNQIESEEIAEMVDDIFDIRMSGGVSCRQFYYRMIGEAWGKIKKLQDILDRYYYPF